eukprot:6191315-Pleurochrysis_carterae.AAC.1
MTLGTATVHCICPNLYCCNPDKCNSLLFLSTQGTECIPSQKELLFEAVSDYGMRYVAGATDVPTAASAGSEPDDKSSSSHEGNASAEIAEDEGSATAPSTTQGSVAPEMKNASRLFQLGARVQLNARDDGGVRTGVISAAMQQKRLLCFDDRVLESYSVEFLEAHARRLTRAEEGPDDDCRRVGSVLISPKVQESTQKAPAGFHLGHMERCSENGWEVYGSFLQPPVVVTATNDRDA